MFAIWFSIDTIDRQKSTSLFPPKNDTIAAVHTHVQAGPRRKDPRPGKPKPLASMGNTLGFRVRLSDTKHVADACPPKKQTIEHSLLCCGYAVNVQAAPCLAHLHLGERYGHRMVRLQMGL